MKVRYEVELKEESLILRFVRYGVPFCYVPQLNSRKCVVQLQDKASLDLAGLKPDIDYLSLKVLVSYSKLKT